MTTVGEISVKISADLAPLRKAQADALKLMGDLDKALQRSATQINKAFNVGSGSSGKSAFRDRAADIEAYGRALDDLRAKYNQSYAIQLKYEREVEGITKALNVGAISQQEYANALDSAKTKYDATISAIQRQASELEKLHGIQSKINNNFGFGDTSRRGSSGEDIAAYGRELDKLQAKFNPIFAAELKHKQGLEEINRALAVGAINQSEYNRALSVAETNFQTSLDSLKQGPPTFNQFAKGAKTVGDSVKLSANEIQNMSFQFNDLFVQLASGQSAFTAITQQGAQIVQIFGPGTGVVGALKATGGALAQFLINPLNLAVVGIAVAAAAIPRIWSAVTGSDSDLAKASLIEFDQLVKNIGLSSESSAKSLEKMTQRPFSQTDLSYQADLSREQQQKALQKALENTAKRAQDTSNAMAILEASNAAYGVGVTETAQKQNELVQKMADLSKEAANGGLTVQELRDRLREIALDPQASEETRKLANELFVGTQEAFRLEGQLKATANAAIQLGTAFRNATAIKGGRNGDQTVATDLAARIDSEGIEKLKNDLISQKNELENVAGELGVFEVPTPERRPTRELGYNGDEFGTGKKPKKAGGSGERDKDFLANLQSETMYLQQQLDIMGKSYDERVRLTEQYKLEKDIRDALTRLGEKATPAQKAAVEEQIRLQQQLNAELQKQEAINQVVSDAQIEAAGLIGSAINGAITGSKDLKSAMLDVAIAIAKAALQAQLLQSFSNGKGGLSFGGSIISALFGGLAGARAKGGPVSQGSSYLVGEEGPEIFTANRSGVIVPNNKLGSGSIGGNSNSTSTTSDVRVWVDDDGNWQAAVERIATKTSANTTRQGIAEYDRAMPSRLQQINQNPSRR